MKATNVNQYIALREALVAEKATLEARLAAIRLALEGKPATTTPKPEVKPRTHRRGKRAKNALTMKEAAAKALAVKSLDRQGLLAAIQKLGYTFTAKDPLNSLSALLYSDRSFKNSGGKFSVGK